MKKGKSCEDRLISLILAQERDRVFADYLHGEKLRSCKYVTLRDLKLLVELNFNQANKTLFSKGEVIAIIDKQLDEIRRFAKLAEGFKGYYDNPTI